MSVDIREFDPSTDLPDVLAIGRRTPEFAAGEHILFWSGEILEAWRRRGGGPMLVALDSHVRMVGFLLATVHPSGIATLENIHVADHARRQGVAGALLEGFEWRSRLAGASVLRSFGHTSNVAVSRLLAGRGYVDAVRVHWCSGAPAAMIARESLCLPSTLEFRPLSPDKVNRAWLADARDEGLANGLNCCDRATAMSRLLAYADVLLGAFRRGRLMGLAAVSVHEPTSKATIESIVTASVWEDAGGLAAFVGATLPLLAERGVAYVTAHPSVDAPAMVEHLMAAGFARQREFQLQSKAC